MASVIPENRVLEIWQSPVQQRADLKTVKNEPVRIIYPGRPNDGRGADLRDAVIATPQGLLKGDIEIHVKSGGWQAHSHDADPTYNSVVLHIVQQHDAGKTILLRSGREIPTLSLETYSETQSGQRITSVFSPVTPADCQPACRRAAPGTITDVLDQAGEARFLAKTQEFRTQIQKESPGQALYRGIMIALGYSKNKQPMENLARALPLFELEAILNGKDPDAACRLRLESRLLGTAGLLPFQRVTNPAVERQALAYQAELERLWDVDRGEAQMSARDWEFFKVRPGNSPVRRIAAMAVLLVHYRKTGILEGLAQFLTQAAAGNQHGLENSLLADASSYWSRYIDFSLPVKSKAPALLGKDRAAEIIINVLLPFFAACGRAGKPEEKERQIFHHLRAPAENSLEKHMRRQFGLPPDKVATAQRRQGLLHIYKTLCTQGKCGVCPLQAAGQHS